MNAFMPVPKNVLALFEKPRSVRGGPSLMQLHCPLGVGKLRPNSRTNSARRKFEIVVSLHRLHGGGNQRHPTANALTKHWKSFAVSGGTPELPSQLAYVLEAANALMKH